MRPATPQPPRQSTPAHPPSSTAPRLTASTSTDGWVRIPPSAAIADRLADGSKGAETSTVRYHVCIDGRFVSVIRSSVGKLFCIDSICFHAGGPLALGDIEDIDDKPCLVCPWHFYHCSLEDGQKFYRQVAVQDGKAMAGRWQSVGVRQRTHEVEERNDGVYVRLSTCLQTNEGARHVESDRYAFEQETGDRIWSMSKFWASTGPHQPKSGRGGSPRSTPPASPRRDRGSLSGGYGGICGVSSESEEVWPVSVDGGDVSSGGLR